MKLNEKQLKNIIRQTIQESFRQDPLSRFGTLENFLQTVIWPCYQDGETAMECYRTSLGTEEMQFLRRHRESILEVNGKPEFIRYAYEVASMV